MKAEPFLADLSSSPSGVRDDRGTTFTGRPLGLYFPVWALGRDIVFAPWVDVRRVGAHISLKTGDARDPSNRHGTAAGCACYLQQPDKPDWSVVDA